MKVKTRQKGEKLQIEKVKLVRETVKVKTRQKSEKLQIKPVKLEGTTLVIHYHTSLIHL